MNFDVQIAHSVEEIGREAWDDLGRGRPFSSHRWYRFGETVLADNTPIYIILSRQGRPVARATFWLRHKEALPISSRVTRWMVERVLNRWPLLVCQSPLIESSGLILPEPPLRDAALEAIARIALDQAGRHRACFLVFDYLEEGEARYTGWPDAFVPIEIAGLLTRLNITWADFESYYNHLSKSTRAQYRRNCNRAADLGVEIVQRSLTREPLDVETLDLATRQIWDVELRHKSGPTPWARPMLQHAGMVEGVFLKTAIDGHMVGNFTVLGDGDTWKMTLLGRDHNVRYAYFQLIYTAIGCAIEGGARVLWGGSGVYDMKRKLGFDLVRNNHMVFAGRDAWLRRLGRWVAGMKKNGAASLGNSTQVTSGRDG